jgi:hypothetical protein
MCLSGQCACPYTTTNLCIIIYQFTNQLLTMKNVVFWDVALCRTRVNRCFGGTYRLHLQGGIIRSRNIPEDNILHSHRCESLKSYKYWTLSYSSLNSCSENQRFGVNYLGIAGVLDFIHRPDFNSYKKREQTRRFGNWICFRPQVRGDTYSVGFLRKS